MHCDNLAQAEWEFHALCIIARCGEFIPVPYAQQQGGYLGGFIPDSWSKFAWQEQSDINIISEWIILTF